MSFNVPFVPQEASSAAPQVDALFYALLAFSLALGLLLTCLVVGYAVKYRAGSSADRTGERMRTLPLEITWTTASLLISFAFFGWGAALYVRGGHPPPDAIQIAGLGKQWMWTFRHPGGQREINELHVPVGKPVVVSLASQDVIHSFFVPAFRVKQDAVPGRATHVWFTATRPGRYHLFCAEYCGTQHSEMGGWIDVMAPEQYAAWLSAQGESESLAQGGEKLFRALGCSGCHGNSSKVRAPDLAGVFGRPVALSDRQTVVADERYLRDSILNPMKEVAAGYQPVMPSFEGLVDEAELQMLVAYLKSLSPKGGAGAAGPAAQGAAQPEAVQ
ncbi:MULTISPECIES: cytochrome c oxidase subunit II [unclassified Mesorhizobium]|uniref:cytochrome c oxidase subunit II n=1 Tax=unclassified Mesorhizobium TaxID=325217 RepID=UPI0007ED35A5|nr:MULTISPECIES: cytochrome c oxidase subunit II [unclassified Mesorhizobium]RVA36385.1 cytochrome c oxidase subunit II [Mesorhizobium sp. M7A.F.Ca.US.001.01.1.1]ARP65682.1 cytochrome c oxidase subunit II [Mesorhizobium sp. WSM1497]MBZ9889180.1 cytochrome c oxidase subunit II [Mesorhizobium sp. BR1-1-3]RVA05328.1 cytochrome c oxidase subunit II [Mesorhizobium sp. M7A.F.Ca.US.001.02.1.1]RVA09432.1 cytochrome c oxidase subunit II [Mesorhizobium sp. M7A.F.Ca.US.002.01.1.1]